MNASMEPLAAKRGRPSPVGSAFEEHRDTITRLWHAEDQNLSNVIQLMEIQGFSATPKQYKTRLNAWGLWKNIRKREMSHLARIKVHHDAVCKSIRLKLHGVDVEMNKIDRWIKAQRKKLGDDNFMSSIQGEISTPPEIVYDTEENNCSASQAEALVENCENETSPVAAEYAAQDFYTHRAPNGAFQHRDMLADLSSLSEDLMQYAYGQYIPSQCPSNYQTTTTCLGKLVCLRCEVLGLDCRKEESSHVCLPCLELVGTREEGIVLRFSECIRTSLSDVDFFADSMPSAELHHETWTKAQNLPFETISLSFNAIWELDRLVRDLTNWLLEPEESRTSKVGTMCSPDFLGIVTDTISAEAALKFQRMLFAASLAHVQSGIAEDEMLLSTKDLIEIGSLAGHAFLGELESQLQTQNLARLVKGIITSQSPTSVWYDPECWIYHTPP